ncbi:DUF2357 domain-containing protein [Cohnella sp. CFH 77786]|uniref:restriction endonuclease-like protein n=1 Tax=Cohnella sp. CFH 77786 TaxID=2662265 RepID=UPI001C609A42|nr:restriction endonuclease-like protein [Cohnella sp. CFH 77786]MBW5447629.1 DUF2357 domain-containing protein [Cohnella sp. CFH 77786]
MALPLTGSLNRAVELLRIETNWFQLYIQGKPFHPTVETLQLHREEDSSWVNARFEPQSLHSELKILSVERFSPAEKQLAPWDLEQPSPPLFYETQTYELVVELEPDIPLTFFHENLSLREAILPKGKRLLSGLLNFQNEVGFTELELRLHGEPVFRLQLEIFPSKMDYKKDYEAILRDVNEQIYNLSFDFLRKTYNLMGLKESRNQSLSEFFVILQQVFQQLVHQVELIQSTPNHRLRMENRLVDSARVKKTGRANVSFLAKRPHLLALKEANGQLHIQGKSYTPTCVLETRRHMDYDTLENRFVRWVLLRVQQRLKMLKQLLAQRERVTDPVLQAKLNRMQSDLQRLLKLDFLQVGDMTQLTISLVLQMAPGYREVYRNYLLLMKGLSIQNELFRLSMKDLAQLYEYWCFLKIHDLLSRKYELVSQNVIKLNRGGLFVTLDRTKDARMVYRNPKNGEQFTLYYNSLPSGDRSQTVSQRPDNVLTLRKQHSAIEYKYVFDAKYRINPAYEGTSYRRNYLTPGPQEEDINTMHRYRDAIVYESSEGEERREYERTMFGAYVLFPFPNEEEYRQHPFYRSIELVNVGAFPFLPSATSLVEQFLDELIMDSPEKAYERATQQRGTKEYYADKLAGKNVLVGALSHKDQLRDLQEHRFYHVPLKQFADHGELAKLEYVAIYQSIATFGRERAGIYLYGRIKSWSVLPREQIREIPSRRGATTELYVKFDVEEWLIRDRPILPGKHGVHRVLLTSEYIFGRAEELAELRLESEEQLRDWREKRRRGKVNVKWDAYNVDHARVLESLAVADDVEMRE